MNKVSVEAVALFFTDYLAYLLVIYAFYKFVKTGNTKMMALPLLALLISSLISNFSGVPRPFVLYNTTPLTPHIADGSFPSDHASLVFGIALSQGSLIIWLAALMVAFARVYTQLHWPFDIVGSFALVLLLNYGWMYYETRDKSSPKGKN
ncbi:MAG: phosphatase PAP2 family protein [Candidatus Altiarchaeota archaeon]|nr:phosphatase PAP2 family protein [Candidatus Altiarchaeota archaeon]